MRMNFLLSHILGSNGNEVVIILLFYQVKALLKGIIKIFLQIHPLSRCIIKILFVIGSLTMLMSSVNLISP